MTTVYIAASWSRQLEMREVAKTLKIYGVQVTSRWLYEESTRTTDKFRRACALIDVEDVERAQILIRFSDNLNGDPVPSHLATGARHFEMGYAWGLGKPIIVVGERQHAFDFLPNVILLKDVHELINYLSPEEIN